MPSIFPYLLSYLLFVPTFLRIVVALYFFNFGYKSLFEERSKKEKFYSAIGLWPVSVFLYSIALLEIVCAVLLFVGLFTQIAAAVLGVIAIVSYLAKSKHPVSPLAHKDTYLLLLVILISLFFAGAGYIAIDLPL